MNKIALIAGLAAAASSAYAVDDSEVLLIVDLSVVDSITITATDGVSAADVSGPDSTGVLLADFFNGAGGPAIFDSAGVGNLTSASNSSDGTPALFNSSASFGLNIWSYTDDADSIFTDGSLAFSGSATWSLDADEYAAALAGNLSGDIYAFADTDDDIPAATFIGTYIVVPTPSTAALLGLGGLVATRRRR